MYISGVFPRSDGKARADAIDEWKFTGIFSVTLSFTKTNSSIKNTTRIKQP